MKLQQVTVYDMNGNPFLMNGENDSKYVSVMAKGYVITPEGKFITISDEEDHSDIFSRLIAKFYGEDIIFVDTVKGAKILTDNGFIVYLGVNISDVLQTYDKQREVDVIQESMKNKTSLLFPSIYHEIPEPQRVATLDLLKTNRSVLGDYNKLHIEYGTFIEMKQLSKEEVLRTLQTTGVFADGVSKTGQDIQELVRKKN